MSTHPFSSLLGEFPVPALSAWQQEVERLLKGAPFAKKMFTRTWEGITVGPMYTAADLADLPWRDSLPGEAPFVRGRAAAGYHAVPWLVAQEYRRPQVADFNRGLQQGLRGGQTAVNLVLVQGAGQNARGTAVADRAAMAAALAGVDFATRPVFLQAGPAALPAFAALIACVREQGADPAQLTGCVGCAPWAEAAAAENPVVAVSQVLDEVTYLTAWAQHQAPGLRTLPVAEQPWHEGGADLALSLGLVLAEAVAVLRATEERGLDLAVTVPRFQFNLEIGTDFFMEMAKLRALRLLWSRILTAAGVPAAETAPFIHARTARRTQTVLDPHVNMLRATTQAMSAVLGGADSLCVRPFDEVARETNAFSERVARNVQLILAHECHLDQVIDPAGGSWYVESLTRDLAAAAWQKFQAVEEQGGLAGALTSGWAQEQVATAAAARARGYATRKHVLVGTNMYPVAPGAAAADDDKSPVSRPSVPATRQPTEPEVLAELAKAVSGPAAQIVEALITAAAGAATLDELATCLRKGATTPAALEPIPLRRDAVPFEQLRVATAQAAAQNSSAGRVFTLCLGDFARYMPRLEFARGFAQVGGFVVAGNTFFTEPESAVAAATADGARIVVLVGLDETYAEQAAGVAQSLLKTADPPLVVLAGAPGEQETAWRAAGIASFIHVGCDVLQTLTEWLPTGEVQS